MIWPDLHEFYRGRNVLVTGGLGFIGSNLAVGLAQIGARVTVIDAAIPGCGANRFNLSPAASAVRVIPCNIGDAEIVPALEKTEVAFNLAGEISHIHSMLFPVRDLEINTLAQLRFLEAVAKHASRARVVYASTRQVYGTPRYLPVDEQHPVVPVDYNGVHKLAACEYHQLLTRLNRIDAIVLRLSNVFGPRMALSIPCQGFLSVFAARAVTGEPITVFGDGSQLRDAIFVEDACEAFLRAGMAEKPSTRVINIGAHEFTPILSIAQEISSLAGLPEPRLRPFPDDRKAIDIGSYVSSHAVSESVLGWVPRITLRDGLRRTLDYYGQFRGEYLPEGSARCCPLGHA